MFIKQYKTQETTLNIMFIKQYFTQDTTTKMFLFIKKHTPLVLCVLSMLLPGIEIPIYMQTINFMRLSETFWISIKNKDILYRSASMNTLTVWRM
jgi:hypothetical protein